MSTREIQSYCPICGGPLEIVTDHGERMLECMVCGFQLEQEAE